MSWHSKDWLRAVGLGGAALGATVGFPAIGGLLGGALGTATAPEAGSLLAGELASQAVPGELSAATMPALEQMTTPTFPYGQMPADPLQWDQSSQMPVGPSQMTPEQNAQELAGGGAPVGALSQYWSAGDVPGLLGTIGHRAAGALAPLNNPKVGLALQLARMGMAQPQMQMPAGRPPQPMPYGNTAAQLTPLQKQQLMASRYLYG